MSALESFETLGKKGYGVSLCSGERMTVCTIIDWEHRRQFTYTNPNLSKAIYGAISKMHEKPE